jgi:hypothetical protein
MVEAPRDFVELFRCLNVHKAEYLIVGGYAVAFHGYPRFTGDLDLFVNPHPDNAARVLSALEEFGFAGLGLVPEDFDTPDLLVSLGYPPERVDIVSAIDGVSWEEAWKARFPGSFGGADVFFIGRAELIRNKRSSLRPQDRVDADALDAPPAVPTIGERIVP